MNKSVSIGKIISWSFHHVIWLLGGASFITYLYYAKHIDFRIPWVAISVIGTAVAFYAGFKNNQAYDRMWEARKIWGGIVNDSRAWGMMVDGYVSNLHTKTDKTEEEIHEIKRGLIYRHIAWLYQHRRQLLVH
ncbi:MAG: bestrophin family ion channel, partial [Flavobacteriales bacterium]